jgi:hypothetical protein
MTDTERLAKARQSGRSERDQQLLIDQSKRQESEKAEHDDRFEGNIVRQKTLRLARAEVDRLASKKAVAGSGLATALPKPQSTQKGRR